MNIHAWFDDHPLWAVALIVIPVLSLCLWAAMLDQNAWDNYSRIHHCEPIGIHHGQLGVGIGSDGKGPVTTVSLDQTIYRCDGGEIDIR